MIEMTDTAAVQAVKNFVNAEGTCRFWPSHLGGGRRGVAGFV